MSELSGRQPARAAFAAFFGTMIEWYDFYCYGTAAALVFGDVFFATDDAFMGTLASLATFAVGFVARPLGALVGHVGDRVGRKRSLIITLTVMGIATMLIGLPSYHSIGISAAVLLVLLRLFQGIAVGGEWGGAVLIAAERAAEVAHDPGVGAAVWQPHRPDPCHAGFPRGVGHVAAGFPKLGMARAVSFSAVLVIVAFLIRRGVDESPELEERLKKGRAQDVAPVRLVFQKRKKALILGIGLSLLGISGFYFITTLMITYTTTYIKVARSDILDIVTWAGVVEILSFPIASYIANRIGERKFLAIVTGAAVLWSAPMMMLIVTGSVTNIAVAILIATFFIGAYYAVLAPYLPKAFPIEMRYTGISLSFQLCGAIFGGTTPLIGLWVVHQFGLNWPPLAIMFALIAGGTFLSAIFLPTQDDEHAAEARTRPMVASART